MPETSGSVVIEADPPTGASATAADGTEALPPGQPLAPERKCPFLAGRPPHGSYHLWPSGVNVCYARGAGEKSYGHASKETQERCCLAGAGVFESCSDYTQARAHEVPLPMFDGAGPSQHRLGHEAPARRRQRERVKRRRHHNWFRQWWQSSARANFVCACWILLALISFLLVLRSM
jgi:hypothetical protein